MDDSGERQGSDGRLPLEALVGVVETALAKALALAAEAGRWEIVVQLDRRERDDGTCGAR